jgi:Uncharacterized protein conserved in bacteria (DUF2334)
MIFYRIDDIGDDAPHDIAFIETLECANVPYILAVIPMRLSESMARRLRECRYATIFQHGVAHESSCAGERNEFPEGCGQVHDRLADGKDLLEDKLGVGVCGYTPPWNNASSSTLRALEQLEFRWLSGHVRRRYETRLRQLNVMIDPIPQYHPVRLEDPRRLLASVLVSGVISRKAGIVFHPRHYPLTYFGVMLDMVQRTAWLAWSLQRWQTYLASGAID